MYINRGNDPLSCKLFPGTLRGVAMHWLATLPSRSIRSFNDLAASFVSQFPGTLQGVAMHWLATLPSHSIRSFNDLAFAANRAKRLEVDNLFDIRQAKGETLKSYVARFNNATVRVNDPDQKFFMKAFQKGLRVGSFSDSLALRRPTCAEKHIKVEEDQAYRLEAERHSDAQVTRPTPPGGQKGDPKYPTPQPKDYLLTFTPCADTMGDMPHVVAKIPEGGEGPNDGSQQTRLMRVPQSIRPLHGGIERLIQEGHLGHYILGRGEKDPVCLRSTRKRNEDESLINDRENTRRKERRRERSRSRQRRDTRHWGIITTISGDGASMAKANPRDKRRARDVLAVCGKANTTPSPMITFSERDMRYE
ncbi:hypothetical protein CR513_56009, partial [Mucuna pruriens]